MLSKKTIINLQQLNINLAVKDLFNSVPFIVPITFKPDNKGADLLHVLKTVELSCLAHQQLSIVESDEKTASRRQDLLDSLKPFIEGARLHLCFIRRNYDFSETYFLLTDMCWQNFVSFHDLVVNQKGGVYNA